MRYIIFALIIFFSSLVHAADMQPGGTAEAESRADQASSARAERDAARAAKREAERKAAEEAERAAREAAERRAAEEAERAAREAAERRAAEEAERAAREATERRAAEEAERAAREAAEQRAAEEAERAAREAAERRAAEEAERASQAVELTERIKGCSIPVRVASNNAARAIANKARADAQLYKSQDELTRGAQRSVARLTSSYGLDKGKVSRAYFAALCQRLYEASNSSFSLSNFLTRLAALFDLTYPAAGDGDNVAKLSGDTPEEAAERRAAEEAERAAKEAAERRAAEEAERAAREAAERRAAEEAERAAREAAERRAAEEAERAAREAAERRAAEEAERAARESAERRAAEEAERAAREAAERRAAEEEAERAAREAAERRAAEEQAVQTAVAGDTSRALELSDRIEECAIPVRLASDSAANAIAAKAKTDAERYKSQEDLTEAAQSSIASLASGYALDQGTVRRAYFAALCERLYEASNSPFSLSTFLTRLAALFDLTYPASGDGVNFAKLTGRAASSETIPEDSRPDSADKDEAETDEEDAAGLQTDQDGDDDSGNTQNGVSEISETVKAEQPETENEASGRIAQNESSGASETVSERRSTDAPAGDENEEIEAAQSAESPSQDPDSPTEQRLASGSATGFFGENECRALGIFGYCADFNAMFAKLLEKPLQYNHPKRMLVGKPTNIGLTLWSDWEGTGLPENISETLKGLPGDVRQALTKVTETMSAELTGPDFDISPSGLQQRTITPEEPASWRWSVKPSKAGKDQTLKLQLYAHMPRTDGATPPILVKTLDRTITIDATMWDRFLAQAQTANPNYLVFVGLFALLTLILMFIAGRDSRAADRIRRFPEPGGYFDVPNPYAALFGRRTPGSAIGDLSQSARDSGTFAPPSSESSSANDNAAGGIVPPLADDDRDEPEPGDGADDTPGRGFEPKKD